jgi:hypothetical protein
MTISGHCDKELPLHAPIGDLTDIYGIWDGDTRQRSWLRRYATSRKVAGSIPDEVIKIFQLP